MPFIIYILILKTQSKLILKKISCVNSQEQILQLDNILGNKKEKATYDMQKILYHYRF